MTTETLVAISGGVGGAKLALGLSHVLAADALTIVANTGDDFDHLGLRICPDLDTVMYTLSDLSNKEMGWGQAGETWQFLDALKRLGGDSWFSLGDRDLATHVIRTERLAAGETLSGVTRQLCHTLGIRHPLVPMTDDPVATIVHTPAGAPLAFQHYFVRDRCEPEVSGFEFSGIETARPSSGYQQALATARGVVICPSNPFVSVAPVLNIPGVRDLIKVPVVAVSPIVAGLAIKGPAAKMMAELGMPQTALAVAAYYQETFPGLLSAFVIDEADADQAPAIADLGLEPLVTATVMVTLQDRIHLAREVEALITRLAQP